MLCSLSQAGYGSITELLDCSLDQLSMMAGDGKLSRGRKAQTLEQAARLLNGL